jgi:hypothetical protein
MRATRDGFGTMGPFPCTHQPDDPAPEPAGPNGKAPLLVGILLNNMTKVLGADHESHQLHVQGQITLKEFYAAATAAGMSVQRSALPWWQGLTLAGIMSTTSHGSGFNRTSMIVSIGGGAPPLQRGGGAAAMGMGAPTAAAWLGPFQERQGCQQGFSCIAACGRWACGPSHSGCHCATDTIVPHRAPPSPPPPPTYPRSPV